MSLIKIDVLLPPDLLEFVNGKVESGKYNSASEVVHDGLRLLKEQDAIRQRRLDDLRRELMLGYEQVKRGECKAYKQIPESNLVISVA